MFSLFRIYLAVSSFQFIPNTLATAARNTANAELYPTIADTSHASPSLVDFFKGYYTAKSQHYSQAWLNFFHPTQVMFFDVTDYISIPNRTVLDAEFPELVKSWRRDGRSYPIRILGNTESAIVHSVDTPGLFGTELRVISAIDFCHGKVTRQVDYWDGRGNSLINSRAKISPVPFDLGLPSIARQAAPEMSKAATQLNAALAAGDFEAAALLFSHNAVFEDLTLRIQQEGRLAIAHYLQRALPQLPYGHGSTLLHILGSSWGGGYEWRSRLPANLNGVTSLVLDASGAIIRLSTVWDSSLLSESDVSSLVLSAIEP